MVPAPPRPNVSVEVESGTESTPAAHWGGGGKGGRGGGHPRKKHEHHAKSSEKKTARGKRKVER
jgi:hypothetical protein